jgi:hypothetical protein
LLRRCIHPWSPARRATTDEWSSAMACFPKIDQPCPLGIDAQKRIDGYCGHCSKAVHSLDAMSDAERIGFLRNASGPMCVSYRVRAPRSAALGLGAVLVLSMAGQGHADPVGGDAAAAAPATATAQAAVVAPPPKEEPPVMMMGGVSAPASATFIDEDDAPELPTVHE